MLVCVCVCVEGGWGWGVTVYTCMPKVRAKQLWLNVIVGKKRTIARTPLIVSVYQTTFCQTSQLEFYVNVKTKELSVFWRRDNGVGGGVG